LAAKAGLVAIRVKLCFLGAALALHRKSAAGVPTPFTFQAASSSRIHGGFEPGKIRHC
jgi:hypothetical protein